MYDLDQLLPGFVLGMGLAGKYQHNRLLRIGEQPFQAGQIGEDQRSSLVGSKAAGEADHQRVIFRRYQLAGHPLSH